MSEGVRVVAGGKYAVFDGMTWPVPGEVVADIEWRLRYSHAAGELSKEDRLFVASVLSAYRQMFEDTVKKRNGVVRNLRQAAVIADVEASQL